MKGHQSPAGVDAVVSPCASFYYLLKDVLFTLIRNLVE